MNNIVTTFFRNPLYIQGTWRVAIHVKQAWPAFKMWCTSHAHTRVLLCPGHWLQNSFSWVYQRPCFKDSPLPGSRSVGVCSGHFKCVLVLVKRTRLFRSADSLDLLFAWWCRLQIGIVTDTRLRAPVSLWRVNTDVCAAPVPLYTHLRAHGHRCREILCPKSCSLIQVIFKPFGN